MTLSEATAWALQAAEAGDMKELARAVQARGAAIAAGDLPTAEIFDDGERVCTAIEMFKRKMSVESARLTRFREFLPPAG